MIELKLLSSATVTATSAAPPDAALATVTIPQQLDAAAGVQNQGIMMSAAIPSSMTIESFALSVADIRSTDLDKLHALSLSVHWPHRAEDWSMLLEVGHGFAALDGIGRVLATAMWFPQGHNFATVGMVITSPRLQTHGAGHWLMRHTLQGRTGQIIALNATRAAERLYLSLGFRTVATVYQHQGEARGVEMPTLHRSESLRDLGPDDMAAVLALDLQAARCDRSLIYSALLQRGAGLGLFRNGTLTAFAFRRLFGRGTVIGPVVASHDRDAIAITAAHIASSAGTFVRLDTRQRMGAFAEFLTAAGLNLFDTVTSMSLGTETLPWSGQPDAPVIYGLSAQATG